MTTKEILKYVMETPCNTNPAILQDLLENIVIDGSSLVSLKIGETVTGEPGSNAEVTNSGTDENIILNFTIPRGNNGEPGPSPEIGENGNWFIEGVDTNKPSFGADEEARRQIENLNNQIELATSLDIDKIFA